MIIINIRMLLNEISCIKFLSFFYSNIKMKSVQFSFQDYFIGNAFLLIFDEFRPTSFRLYLDL